MKKRASIAFVAGTLLPVKADASAFGDGLPLQSLGMFRPLHVLVVLITAWTGDVTKIAIHGIEFLMMGGTRLLRITVEQFVDNLCDQCCRHIRQANAGSSGRFCHF